MTGLHDPLNLPNGQTLPNRIMKSALGETLGDKRHGPDHRIERLYQRWSKGGYGLIVAGNVIVDLTQLGEPDNIVIEDDRDLAGLSLGQGHQGGNRRGTRPQLAHRPTAPARRRPGPRPRLRASRHHGRDAAPQRSRGPAEAWGKRQRRVDHHEGPRELPAEGWLT